MTTRPVAHHYSYFLKAGGPKLSDLRNTGPLGPIYKLSLELPRDIAALRQRQSMAGTSKPPGANTAISETIALHQRKLRATEARIDHALDLVTRSFGVNQSTPDTNVPATRSPEVRQIREALNKTQRISTAESERPAKRTMRGATPMRTIKSPVATRKKREVESKLKQSPVPPPPPATLPVPQSVKIYKANPVAAPIHSLTSPKKVLSKDKIDRNKVTQLCVVLGNTHVYEETPPDFVNTFAKMESFKAIDDVNPAGLPRYRAKVDMNGFQDNEITFQCDGKKVIITGNRPKKNMNNARRVVEVLELPPGIFPEKLRIARDNDGVLHIEERWTLE